MTKNLLSIRYGEFTQETIDFIDFVSSNCDFHFALILCDYFEKNIMSGTVHKIADVRCYCLLQLEMYEELRSHSYKYYQYFKDDKFKYYYGVSLVCTGSSDIGLKLLSSIERDSDMFEIAAWMMDNKGHSTHPLLTYDSSKLNRLRYRNSIIDNLDRSYSQALQDLFILSVCEKTNGTYLEFGSADPVLHSNTYNLELLGWTGESIEFEQSECTKFMNTRNNKVHCMDALKFDYDGFKNRFGTEIDYLQVDIEPPIATFQVLNQAIRSGIVFKCVTFEHDRFDDGENVVIPSRNLMRQFGYELVVANVSYIPHRPFEDWYIHSSVINPFKNLGLNLSEDVEHNILDIFFK